jgi:hypothetical protein
MKAVVRTDEYTIYQRRDDRYAVLGADKKSINGDEKAAILSQHELIKVNQPTPVEVVAQEEEEVPAEAQADALEKAVAEKGASTEVEAAVEETQAEVEIAAGDASAEEEPAAEEDAPTEAEASAKKAPAVEDPKENK